MTTTRKEVIADIAAVLISGITELNTMNCFVVAEEIDYMPDNLCVQIVPDVLNDELSIHADGYAKDSARIVFYRQLLTDVGGQDTQKLTDASNGLMKLIEDCESVLNNNYLSGKLVSPMRPLSAAPGARTPNLVNGGWAKIVRTYQFSYERIYPAPQNES